MCVTVRLLLLVLPTAVSEDVESAVGDLGTWGMSQGYVGCFGGACVLGRCLWMCWNC
jgi:hypothetical protein